MAIRMLQRKCACGQEHSGGEECPSCREKKEARLQRSPLHGPVTGNAPAVVHEVLDSPGRELDAGTRGMMEPRFGHDFSNVRVHTDDKAAASARAVDAQAYTVGHDIVFGAGSYAPHQPAGQQLLAHELTHVVQQSSFDKPAGDIRIGAHADPLEQEAESNATALSGSRGNSAAPQRAGTAALQKSPYDPPSFGPSLNLPSNSVSLTAGEQPSTENPKLVQLAAAYKAMAKDSPDAYIKLSTYLSDAAKLNSARAKEERGQLSQRMNAFQQALVMLGVPAIAIEIEPPTVYSAKGAGEISADLYKSPQKSPLLVPPGGLQQPIVPGPAPAAGKGLSEMLSFKFKAGPVEFAVELPKSVAIKLPLALSASKTLSFELKAESSGDFSFAIVLNGLRHVSIAAKAGLKVDKDKGTSGSVGLEITTTKTVCSAPNPESLKAKINAAGEKLKKAMKELETSEKADHTLKLFDIAGAIGEMYDTIEKAKSGCKQVPRATFSLGLQGPLAPSDKALEEPDPLKRPSTFIGGSITIPF